jgi:cytochrome c-type biogenesis protein
MEVAALGFAFIAGLVSIFSPCVLPLLPVVLGTAVSEHRLGPAALAAGLAISFLVLGLFVATIGFSIGLGADVFRAMAATLLLAAGSMLIIPPLQNRLTVATAPIGNWLDGRVGSGNRSGLAGQFGVGLLLGAVWTPCVGPTLGAASVLAAQDRDLPHVALTMLLFALGASLPLFGLGFASREALLRWRGRMLSMGQSGKLALGVALFVTGALILSGLDKTVEEQLLRSMPPWLTELSNSW